MVTRGRMRGMQARRVITYSVIVVLSTVLFSSSCFNYLFFSRVLLKQAGRGGTVQDRTARAATAMRDGTGGRRAGGGGRRREEGGLAGNMGTAEAEGRATKGCK